MNERFDNSNKDISFAPELDEAVDLLQEKIKSKVLNSMALIDVLFCTVISIKPLKLSADDFKGVVIDRNITVSEKIVNHDVVMEAKPTHHTESTSGGMPNTYPEFASHDHEYKGGNFRAKYALKVNDKVAVIRFSGGQRYWIVDRVKVPDNDDTK